ncbi:CocE/NonD family hydrolase [Rhodoglobus sp. NPDC076762]
MKTSLVKRNSFWLVLSLVMMLVTSIGASIVQTGAGSISVKDMNWETSSGQTMSALLFKPDSATVDNKVPAIVVSHGWWNNREMQDANYVELARRGYVVVSIDMYGHGNSSPLTPDVTLGGTGMYDAVKLVADFPYVDTDKIGVSGHSNGARAANFSTVIDNAADEQLISAILLVDNDAVYTDAEAENAYFNLYGARDVGIVADQYDEFFFRSYSPEGEVLTPPREYIGTPNAQSFLHFGANPEEVSSDVREASEFYTDSVDGEDALRIVYTPAENHPWGTISKTTVGSQIEFFQEAFGAPNEIAAGSQVWQVKETFTLFGLIGFGIFLVAFTRALLSTRAFAGLRAPAAAVVPATRKGLAWFWGGLVVSAIISGWSWLILANTPWVGAIAFNAVQFFMPQGAVFFVAFWAAVNAIAAIIIMVISYLVFGRKNGLDLRASGVLPGWKKFFHGLGLSFVVVVSAYAIVFVLDYFFKTDFRWWVVAVKAFTPDKVGIALMYLPLFAIYFVANSVAVNAFNRFSIRGKEWINTALLAFFNALAPIVLVVAQYTNFFTTGYTIDGFGGIFSIWLYPVILILAVTAVISRKIYRETNNPYIAGFINAAIVTLISVTNTLTAA